jgi:hypothetical protein
MKKLLLVSTILVSGFSTLASAAPYGMAGCGLGSSVISDGGFVQIFAATTNGTSGNQTFGITSGTSNCVDSASHASTRLPLFIENNKLTLKNDAARGSGESLEHLAGLLGCSNSAELQNAIHGSYSQIFSTNNSQEISKEILNVVNTRANLASSCSRNS